MYRNADENTIDYIVKGRKLRNVSSSVENYMILFTEINLK